MGVFLGSGLGTAFYFYLYHTFRNGTFFCGWNRLVWPRFFSSTLGSLYVLYSSCNTRFLVKLVSMKIEVGGSFWVSGFSSFLNYCAGS